MNQNLNNKNHRHCERSEVISSRLPRPNGLAMTNETGRSMVEMLGVLAVIGVLSITGISGYTTAMNKHRANEILDAASKRAVVVSTQLQSGRTDPTLAEFGDDNTVAGATFSTALETQGSDKFVIKFTSGNEPSAEIWAQMQNIAGTTGIVRAYESGRTGLVYNNDLSTDAKASDYNGNQNGCTGASKKYCTGSKLCVETTVNCNTTCTGTDQCKSLCDSNGSWSVGTGDEGKGCKLTSDSTTNDGVCSASGECGEAGPYCATHTCTLSSSYYTWVGARDACGGIENMATIEDVGCSLTAPCTLPISLSGKQFWLQECSGDSCEDNDSAYCVIGNTLDIRDSNDEGEFVAFALCK